MVAGRLQFISRNWQLITLDPWVLLTVQGYEIELLDRPWQFRIASPLVLSLTQTYLVVTEIRNLLQKEAILKVPFNPNVGFYSNRFLVEKKGRAGQRPVINLASFNKYVKYSHFKMEDLKAVADLLRPGDFMCKLDLKDAYFTIPLHAGSQKFTRYQFKGKTYQFTCLPLGLTSAPRTFTKQGTQTNSGYSKENGYPDNNLSRRHAHYEQHFQGCPGRHPNPEVHSRESRSSDKHGKIYFHPVQVIEFLGILVDSTNMRFLLVEENVAAIQQEFWHLVSCQVASLNQLSHIIGKLTSCKIAVLQGPLYYRGIEHLKNSKPLTQLDNNVEIALDRYHHALEDLRWWADNLSLANGRPIRNSLPHLVIQSDASNSGWGAVRNGVDTRGTWTQDEASLHINCKELLAASFAVKAFTKNLQNIHVLIKIDNTTTIAKWGEPHRSLCTTSVELVSRKENHSKGPKKNPRLSQHNSRQGIKSQTRHIRLASEPEFLSDINGQARSVYDRPFCNQNQSATSQVSQLQTRPGNRGDRCPDTTIGNRNRLRLSSIYSNSQMLKATITLVCPIWPTQPWYAQLLQLVVDIPILLPIIPGLLTGPQGQEHPLVSNKTLLLASWRESGEIFLQKAYQDKLQPLSSLPGELQLRISTSHAGQNGWAGVINNKLIPFTLVS